ncbi:flagellar biosynthesis anti-sigma factor FlgM [Sphingobium sufflavum]|uniref:flagellar biosynthesis anti-sigma factor FlgM n=1 Tax=Sphingobium sufflavum TaxID=1129547 RepID=UPI001F41D3EB|nr:flagellar biosynthesis anti-sigma factor FlgM [Sphingobium sufflavum]MCE7797351.1 flagellar biosynthesis anti-sigma factor FlgM [Sphingobium sufflavum]
MIKPVGTGMTPAIDAGKLRETAQTRTAAPVTPVPGSATTERVVANPAARVAQQGAPIDMEKIAKIKAAIASGNYPVDADAIAERMVELDLPRKLN